MTTYANLSHAGQPVRTPLRSRALTAPGQVLAWVVLLGFVPGLLLSGAANYHAAVLQPVVHVPLSNVQATGNLLRDFQHPRDAYLVDSWGPMLEALRITKSADRDALYDVLFFDRKVRFQYPPSSLLVLDVLQRFDLSILLVLNIVNAVLFMGNAAAVAYLTRRVFTSVTGAADGIVRNGLTIVAFVAACVFYPLVRAGNLGQIQVWLDLLFTLTCIAWLHDRRTLAGMLVGLACSIKPQFGVLLVWALAWREWRFVRGQLITMVPIGIASVLQYGIPDHLGYLRVLSFLSQHGESFFANHSVNGIANRLLANGTNLEWQSLTFAPYNPAVHAATVGAGLVAVLLIVVPPVLRRRDPTMLDLLAASICVTAGSPVAWEHHYGILLPAFVVVLSATVGGTPTVQRTLKFVLLGLSWFLTANFIPFTNLLAESKLNFLQAYVFIGALGLLGLIFWELRGEEARSSSFH